MRWAKDGPNIEPELVRGVQEGHLVFFCGAGISQEAGLPGFKGLVNGVYDKLHRMRDLHPEEQRAFDRGDYDQVFTSLEAAVNNPGLVREKVEEILRLSPEADTRTHKALLTLATDSEGRCRLVTTNYDLGFARYLNPMQIDPAPRLPVPKPGRWNSVVHLHGLLGNCGLNKQELILSSADFGAAYLVDGWATRFLLELFRNYIVVFVGYRIDDLVVRYMLQALSVSFATQKPRVFAFAEMEEDEASTKRSWRAKGIEPILYAKKSGSHAALHETLRNWAEKSRHGLLSRKAIVEDYLGSPAPVEKDEVVDQVLWALNDEGATSKSLADQEPSPQPRHWLRTLDEGGLFSLGGAPLVDNGAITSRSGSLNPVTWNLARWLCKHLAEPEVLDWVLTKGGCLAPEFRWLVRNALENQGNPISSEMERAWRFLARYSSRVGPNGDLYALSMQIGHGAWDLNLKHEVVTAIEPVFALKRDSMLDIFRKTRQNESDSYPLDVEIAFGADEVGFVLDEIRRRVDRDSILTELLDDCTACLRRAMEMLQYLGKASPDEDWTWMRLRSIDPSSGSHADRPLIVLIRLAAACLDSAARVSPSLARCQVDYWKTIDYPVFRRLVCYALALPDLFTIEESLSYILSASSPLWKRGCSAEVRRLLADIWPSLDVEPSRVLVSAILNGPPSDYTGTDVPRDISEEYRAHAIEERLRVLHESGRPLPPVAEEFLTRQDAKRISEEIDATAEKKLLTELPPNEVAQVLANGIGDSQALRGEWLQLVTDNPQDALSILRILVAAANWPSDVWTILLDRAVVWAINEPSRHRDAMSIFDLLVDAPERFIAAVMHHLTNFLELVPRMPDFAEREEYWIAWNRTLSVALSDSPAGTNQIQNLDQAIHAPSGRLTVALFEWIRQRSVEGKSDIPEQFWQRLQAACTASVAQGRGPRSVAAMHLGWLVSKNREWVCLTLLPSFDWDRPEEATAVWQGFLVQPYLDSDLWPLLRRDFLNAFENTAKLGSEPTRSLYHQIARIAIHAPTWLSNAESQGIVTKASPEARQAIAWVFWSSLEAAGDRASSLWRDRIGPWLEVCWQPDEALKDPETTASLIRVAVATGDAFPEAVDAIEHRIARVSRADGAIFFIARSEAPERFPKPTVKLLDLVIDRRQKFFKGNLNSLLSKIAQNWPESQMDRTFLGLYEFSAA